MHNLIIRTKIMPPRIAKYTQPRPRLTRRLSDAQDYRLTVMQAGPGYGKSTALAGFSQDGRQTIWYHLDEGDTDPLVFLSHLIHSCTAVLPDCLLPPWCN